MRYLIVSDLHGNWEALEAVLNDAAGQYEKIVCCGDLVGYGPEPARVIEWTRRNVDVVIRGNHDRACCGLEDLEWFNPVAQAASLWTMDHLSPEDLAWLRDLSTGPVAVNGFSLAHGSPLDEDEYVITLADAGNIFDYLDASLTFIGHTHLQGGFYQVGGKQRTAAGLRHLRVEPEGLYLMNPGSVGQPRDGDPRAAYSLYDTDSRDITFLRIEYDCNAVHRKIVRAGLPHVLGARLAMGR